MKLKNYKGFSIERSKTPIFGFEYVATKEQKTFIGDTLKELKNIINRVIENKTK